MSNISIRYDDDGRITNTYNGERAGAWTIIDDSEWPDADPNDDEQSTYYYEEETGEITVEYETVTDDDIIGNS